jgi:Domain of unknown function (DUF4105)
MKMFRLLAWLLVWTAAIVCSAWAFGAIYYDFPAFRQVAAGIFVLILLVAVIIVRRKLLKLAAVFAVCALVLLWWLTLKPSNDGPWQPDVAETAWAEINGDEVIINNVRNCDYRTEKDFTTHWEKRTVRLSQITGLDIAIMYWGSPYMAHPIASFRFADALPICFSIETRKRIGQEYSALRGLYRQYTLIYIVADERDSIRVRTNYRPGEDVYLYHVLCSREDARERFLEYVKALNILNTHPTWYNAITGNCTTNIRTQRPILKRIPWDWRLLVNGKADELLYERHLIATGGLPFTELKQRSQINERARAADQDPDFSRLIREELPKGN